ncbi:unnamed protein product, partial [Staurois parvus]
MVRSEPGSGAGEVSSGSDQAGSAKEQKQDAGQIQGPGQNTTPRQSLQVWP